MSANIPSLSLYHFQSCPYCAMTRRAMNGLGLDIEQRDVLNQPHFRAELIKQGGKSQVPCLRIDNGDGEVDVSDMVKVLNVFFLGDTPCTLIKV